MCVCSDAFMDFTSGILSVTGINATGHIFASYPGRHLTVLGGFVDQVSLSVHHWTENIHSFRVSQPQTEAVWLMHIDLLNVSSQKHTNSMWTHELIQLLLSQIYMSCFQLLNKPFRPQFKMYVYVIEYKNVITNFLTKPNWHLNVKHAQIKTINFFLNICIKSI